MRWILGLAGLLALGAAGAAPAAVPVSVSNGDDYNASESISGPQLPPADPSGVLNVAGNLSLAGSTSVNADPYSLKMSSDGASQVSQIQFVDGTRITETFAVGPETITANGDTAAAQKAAAAASLQNFSLSIVEDGPLSGHVDLLEVSGQSIASSASVDGFTPSGASSIVGLRMSGAALAGAPTVDGDYVNPAANQTLVFNALPQSTVITVLNEQFSDVTPGRGADMFTNALDVTFNFQMDGGVDSIFGSTIIGSSSAGFNSGVPEPGAWVMLLAGFGGIGAAIRARRRGLRVVIAS